MRKINTSTIKQAVYDLILDACINLTPSAIDAITKARDSETNDLARFALDTVIQNQLEAQKLKLPVCQDTGLAVIFLEIGQQVFLEGNYIIDEINEGVRKAYNDGYFRKSCCDPLTRVNTTDNTPAIIHTEIIEGDKINITFLPKGFGSENMSKLYMLTPSQGINGIIDAIVETVRVAKSRPCPPVYVGVGVGGTFDLCALLAKKALLRPVGTNNNDEQVKYIEQTALKRINDLNIGAQGFGGKTTALGVNVITAPTHIAGLPVAVNIQCHAIRSASVTL